MSEHYLTIDAAPGCGVDVELEIKRSRFLARLYRVADEASARAVIDERRATYFDARHHCSAFILGPDSRTARSCDDGEPAGTAGVPMLQVLAKHHLTDVVAVVTRYFGGIKLGAGGLVRAYSDAVAQAVSSAGIRTVVASRVLQVTVDYSEAGTVETQLREMVLPSGTRVAMESVDWAEQAIFTITVPIEAETEFRAALAALSAGCLSARPIGKRWVG